MAGVPANIFRPAPPLLRFVRCPLRWYAPGISEFTQPDTLIPDLYNPLDWNRYSYARYNPIRYNDPSGHYSDDQIFSILKVKNWKEAYKLFEKGGKYEGKWGLLDILRMAENGNSIMGVANGQAGSSNGENLGTFQIDDNGNLYLVQGDSQVLALDALSSVGYHDLTLVRYVSFLGVDSYTGVYIQLSKPLWTSRIELHPEEVDWVNVGLMPHLL